MFVIIDPDGKIIGVEKDREAAEARGRAIHVDGLPKTESFIIQLQEMANAFSETNARSDQAEQGKQG